MGKDAHETLLNFLTTEGANFELSSMATYDAPPEHAIKSLLYRSLGEYALVTLPLTARVSSSALKQALGVKDARMASPEDMEAVTGCTVGSCHAMGKLFGIPTIADLSLEQQALVSFSAGNQGQIVTMSYAEYNRIATPSIHQITA